MSKNGPENCILDGMELFYGIDFCTGSRPRYLVGITIQNTRRQYGAAVWAHESSIIHIQNCCFIDNEAFIEEQGFGGAVRLAKGSICDSTFINNTAFCGGAVTCDINGTINIRGCTFLDNSALSFGGGIYVLGTCELLNSAFIGNLGYRGGAVSIVYGNADILNCELTYNFSAYGSGIYGNNPNSRIHNCIITDNFELTPFYTKGGGIYQDSGRMEISNTTIFNNRANSTGGLYVVDYSPDGTLIENSIIYGNPGGNYFPDNIQFQYSNTYPPCMGEGNFFDEPLLVSGPSGEYYLSNLLTQHPVGQPMLRCRKRHLRGNLLLLKSRIFLHE